MKIDNVSCQSFKALKFTTGAEQMFLNRYKNPTERYLHDKLIAEQRFNPINIEFDINKRGNGLVAEVISSEDRYPYSKLFKENIFERLLSPARFLNRMLTKANMLRNDMESELYRMDALNNFNKNRDYFKL